MSVSSDGTQAKLPEEEDSTSNGGSSGTEQELDPTIQLQDVEDVSRSAQCLKSNSQDIWD